MIMSDSQDREDVKKSISGFLERPTSYKVIVGEFVATGTTGAKGWCYRLMVPHLHILILGLYILCSSCNDRERAAKVLYLSRAKRYIHTPR